MGSLVFGMAGMWGAATIRPIMQLFMMGHFGGAPHCTHATYGAVP